MRATATRTIVATGVLVVTVTPAPSKSYVNTDVFVDVAWSPSPSGDYDIVVQWGDGTSTTSASMSSPKRVGPKRYASPGTYTVTATVTEPMYGYNGTGTAPLQIATQLAATLSASPTSGNVPVAVTFTIGISGGYTPYSWTLDYGDGSTPSSGTVAETKTHTYTKAGTLTATLTVTDALGATAVRLLDLFSGVIPPWLPEWVAPLAGLVPVLFVGGVIGANELQRARVFG